MVAGYSNGSVVDNAGANNHPGDAPALETRSLIRVRGNSSRYFDKKSYLLRFVDGEGEYRDAEVMGMGTPGISAPSVCKNTSGRWEQNASSP